MMVAAHAGDLTAAAANGLRTGFIARPLEHGPGKRTDAPPQADIVSASVEELAGKLGA